MVSGLTIYETEALSAAITADAAAAGSPEEREARKEYAAAALAAALQGIVVPPFEPLIQATPPEESSSLIGLEEIFQDQYDGALLAAPATLDDDRLELLMLAQKSKSKVVNLRQQLRSNNRNQWADERIKEEEKLRKHGTIEDVRADDPRVIQYIAKHGAPVDTMAIGTQKYDDIGNVYNPRIRIVLRGDQMDDISKNESTSPTVRCEGLKSCESNATLREQDEVQYDYEAAYLNAPQTRFVVARPPPGMRRYDEDGTEIYWIIMKALYGGADSGALWNRKANQFFVDPPPDGLNFSRGTADPCVYTQCNEQGGDTINKTLYVDDGKLYNDPTPAARARRDEIKKKTSEKFTIKWREQNAPETVMLSANIYRLSPSKKRINMKHYIEKQAEERISKKLSEYPASWGVNPCGRKLMEEYEKAMTKSELLDKAESERYGGITGWLQYAVQFRPDVAFPVGIGGRCRTFPTKGMMEQMERCVVYLRRTSELGLVYDGKAPDARKLYGRVDSDWYVKRSTTGYVIFLANAAIAHGSHRQHAIACSSTEAELMGLAKIALELLYIQSVLKEIGHEFDCDIDLETGKHEAHKLAHKMIALQHGATEIGTDNSGAFDLCHRDTQGKHSRHVERKMFKMRELAHSGKVKLKLIPTAEMSADMLTKALDDRTFLRHRRTVMNDLA